MRGCVARTRTGEMGRSEKCSKSIHSAGASTCHLLCIYNFKVLHGNPSSHSIHDVDVGVCSPAGKSVYSLCLHPVLSFCLAGTRTPHQLFNFAFPTRQAEQCAQDRRQQRHEHRDACTVRGVAPWVLTRRDGLREERRREEKQAERERRRERHQDTQCIGDRAFVSRDECWRVKQGEERDEIEHALYWLLRHVYLFVSSQREHITQIRTQNDCSAKKFGCRLQDHRPRVQKPRAASSWVHARRAPGQCAPGSYVPCFHAWKANCWLSAVNSHARRANAVRARTPSVCVRGLGWVAAINTGVAIKSRRTFWIAAGDRAWRYVRQGGGEEAICVRGRRVPIKVRLTIWKSHHGSLVRRTTQR